MAANENAASGLQTANRAKLSHAVAALYNQETIPTKLKQDYGVDRRVVAPLLKGMPEGLQPDDGTTLQVRRAADKLVGTPLREQYKKYTQQEARAALAAVASGQTTAVAACQNYGVPERTMRDWQKTLKAELQVETKDQMKQCRLQNSNQFLAAVTKVASPQQGRPAFLNQTELDVFAKISDLKDQAGYGLTKKAMVVEAQHLIRSKGQELMAKATSEVDKKSAQRLLDAKCTRMWINKNLSTGLSMSNGNKVWQRASANSHKRAAAASPILDIIMRGKFLRQYEEHYASKILATPHPLPSQVWNGDEIGIDPNGSWQRVFTLGRKGKRAWRVITGEHAPFWVTKFFWSRADGKFLVPPMIIHKGGDDHNMPASVAYGLDDVDWITHATPSGYMDRAGFRAVAKVFVERSGASASNPQYVYIDGHDSHWDPEALRHFAENNVYVSFLKANDSANDQPNDMGPNAALKSTYSDCYEEWRMTHPTLAYTPEWCNTVLKTAYLRFTQNPKTVQCIQRAFEKSGLCPMTIPGSDENDPPSVSVIKRCAAMAEMSACDPKDQETLKKMRQSEDSVDFSSVTVAVVPKVALASVKLTTPEGNEEVHNICVNALAHHYFEKTAIRPAQDIASDQAAQRRLKKISVKKNAGTCLRNPDTTTGLVMSSAILAQAETVEYERQQRQTLKVSKAAETAAKRVAKAAEAKTQALQVLAEAKRDGGNWKKLTLPAIRSAFVYLGGKISAINGPGNAAPNKNQVIAALEPLLTSNTTSELPELATQSNGETESDGEGHEDNVSDDEE